MAESVALGWLRDKEDFAFLDSAPPFELPRNYRAADVPEDFDPLGWFPALSQGQIGSCAGWGSTTACSGILSIQTGGADHRRFAPFFTYRMGQKRVGIEGDQGCTISGVVQSLMEDGLALDDECEYPDHYDPRVITERAIEAAKSRVIQQHFRCRGGYDDLWKLISSGVGLPIFGVPWTEELAETDGVIEGAGGRNYGGHCVAGAGWSKKRDRSGRHYIRWRNSHGPRYGDNGTALVAPSLIDQFCQDGYSEIIVVTDLSDFEDGPKRMGVFAKNSPW